MPSTARVEGKFDYPGGVMPDVVYLRAIAKKIELDTLFLPIKLTVVKDVLDACDLTEDGQQDFLENLITSAARDLLYGDMIAEADLLLSEVQIEVDKATTTEDKEDILTRNLISVKSRAKKQSESITVKNGKQSGTFELSMEPVDPPVAYMWFVREKGTADWDIADFSQDHTGFCSGFTPNVEYEFRGQSDGKAGKSPFTEIISRRCL